MISRTRSVSLTMIGVLAGTISTSCAQQIVTASAPEIFEPNVISGPANDGAPAFTPDGKTLYFGRSGSGWGFILESHRSAGKWSQPVIAPFSGLWSDSQPALSPDGNRLVFESRRPTGPSAANTLQNSLLWQSNRLPDGWSEPKVLPETVNFTTNMWKPSIAANGDLYFMTKSIDDKTWRLYRSRFAKGQYMKAESLSFSDGTHTDVDPEIAPDQSFLIFSSAGRAAPSDVHEHLYITFRNGDAWGTPVALRYADDYEKDPADDGEAHLSLDGRQLFFTSSRTVPILASRARAEAAEDFRRISTWDNGNNNVWFFSLSPWLDRPR